MINFSGIPTGGKNCMSKIRLTLAITAVLFCLGLPLYPDVPVYKDPQAPVDQRVSDLLGRMTTKEKIGQMIQFFGWKSWTRQGNTVVVSDELKRNLEKYQVGAFYGTLRVDPWTEVTLETGFTPEEAAKTSNMIQKYNMDHSSLGIPLLMGEDVTHGMMSLGATVFPTSLAVAATWNPDLARRMYQAVAEEARSVGSAVVYTPNVDVVRDPRWGRIEETFGEDPFMCGVMGVACVKGYQGENLNTDRTMAATIKHFTHGLPEGGHNAGFVNMGERELREVYLYPFQKAVAAGAASVMAAYADVNGVPCNMNRHLLTDILRGEWGFKGFVVSDAYSVTELANRHGVVEDLTHAAALAVKAGLEMDMSGDAFQNGLQASLDRGLLTAGDIDLAAGRILRLKFLLGLFERPFVDVSKPSGRFNTPEKKALAREVARQSMVLLKNDGRTLPLKKDLASIAVIGPNADNVMNQLGDYTAPQRREWVVTVLDGIKQKVQAGTRVTYEKGCDIRNPSKDGFDRAVAAARNAEMIIAVVGGSSNRPYRTNSVNQLTGQAQLREQALDDMDCGEGFDRMDLGLSGVQADLIAALKATGKPMVVVLVNGRPLSIPGVIDQADAVLEAWYCGSQGGHAVADILFGDCNPSGRLPVSVARSAGQLPVFYGHRGEHRKPYLEMDAEPMFPFGFGLSYTQFEYRNPKLSSGRIKKDEPLDVSVDVTNTGAVAGEETVQLYLHDAVSSVSRPDQSLRGFRKVALAPGETKTVTMRLTPEDLSMFDIDMNWCVEPGTFEIRLGRSAADIRVKATIEVMP
jgi:beta-glucosidase